MRDSLLAEERVRLKKEYERLQAAARRAERRLEKVGAEWLAVANALNRLEQGSADMEQDYASEVGV